MKKDDVILATYAFAAPSPIPQVDLYPRRKRYRGAGFEKKQSRTACGGTKNGTGSKAKS